MICYDESRFDSNQEIFYEVCFRLVEILVEIGWLDLDGDSWLFTTGMSIQQAGE